MSYHRLASMACPPELIGFGNESMRPTMVELHCRKCKRSVEFARTSFPDVPAWVARIEHDKCNVCDDGDRSAEHWMDAEGREPDPDAMTNESQQFPQPRRRDGKEPCGECHLKPGETCDICGAAAEETYLGIPLSDLARSGVLGWHPGDEA